MKLDESPLPQPLYSASVDQDEPGKYHPDDVADQADQSEDDGFEIPFPSPADSGTRGYVVEIFGNERGGQKPKRPFPRKGEPDI